MRNARVHTHILHSLIYVFYLDWDNFQAEFHFLFCFDDDDVVDIQSIIGLLPSGAWIFSNKFCSQAFKTSLHPTELQINKITLVWKSFDGSEVVRIHIDVDIWHGLRQSFPEENVSLHSYFKYEHTYTMTALTMALSIIQCTCVDGAHTYDFFSSIL